MCHEPYVLEALKMYAGSCTDEVLDTIYQYEKTGKFKDVRKGVISRYDENTSTAEITLSQKHSVVVEINENEKVNVGDKIDVVVTKSRGRIMADASSKTARIERRIR